MAAKFINVDRYTEMLLPPNLQDWLPRNDLARFIVDCIEEMNLSYISVNNRGCGSEQYPPKMLLSLLIYCYADSIFSSRDIEKATYRNIAARFICGGNNHPDHSTICAFRIKNKKLLIDCFVKVLQLAKELKILKVGNISVDGTKIKANASKHKAVSYARAEKKIKEIEREVKSLIAKAEQTDNDNTDDRLCIPDELARREERLKKLRKAKANIEERAKEVTREKQEQQRKKGQRPRKDINDVTPSEKDQINFTDEESRIMKAGNGKHFEQAYNAQAAVDTNGSMMILGKYVTNKCNDKQELNNAVDSVAKDVGEIKKVSADNGYLNEDEIKKLECKTNGKTKAYVALGKNKHGKKLKELNKVRVKEKNENLSEGNFQFRIKRRMRSKEGHDFYRLRKMTVEPVFGIIKQAMGFRQFLVRGIEKTNTEWDLVTLAYNFKRMHSLINSS